jgi:ABC-type dipeptide/oligopeptide/nickel transport system permease subunit
MVYPRPRSVRVVDITLSLPQLLLALAFVAASGPSLVTVIVVLGLTRGERYTRVVRDEILARGDVIATPVCGPG